MKTFIFTIIVESEKTEKIKIEEIIAEALLSLVQSKKIVKFELGPYLK